VAEILFLDIAGADAACSVIKSQILMGTAGMIHSRLLSVGELSNTNIFFLEKDADDA